MDINPSNNLHTYKMEHEDDREFEIIRLVKLFIQLCNLHAKLIPV